MKSLQLALRFLTTIPVRTTNRLEPGDLGRVAGWFPVIGLALGGALALVRWAIGSWIPAPLVGVLVTLLWIIFTGGLHLDGLADCCDGLLASADPKRRLEIMKDPCIGAFGAIGLALFILLKATAISSLVNNNGLLLAPILGRWMVIIAAIHKQARSDGMSASFHKGLRKSGLTAAAMMTVLVAGLLGWQGLLAFVLAHCISLVILRLALARIGGVTGDVLGAVCELSELAALIAFTLRLQS